MASRRFPGILALLILLALCGAGAVAADDPSAPSGSLASDEIEDNQTFALAPDHPGEIEVVHTYDIPERVSRFEVRVPQRATVIERSGFVHEGDRTYVWDESTASPTLTYRAAVNRTVDRDDPISSPGDYLFVDTGEWALFQRPSPGHSWSWTGDDRVRLNRTAATRGPGRVSNVVGFLGPHVVHTEAAHDQEFVLVEPEAASLAEDPGEIFASLAHASDQLRVSDRDDRVMIFVAPTGEVSWGVRGLQTGPADMWVRDLETLDTANNVWVHEYVHTRQDFSTTPESRWLTEASATYYAALLTLQENRISFEDFREHLQRGTSTQFDKVKLSDPATWRNNPDYFLGALITGVLDRDIRLARDGGASFADVFRKMNVHDGPIDQRDLLEFLQMSGDESVATTAEEYLTTTNRPTMWSESEHAEAFSPDPPRFRTETVEIRVSGEYRDRALPVDRSPVLVPGETLTLSVEVTNLGDNPGEFDLPVRVGGETIERKTGKLGPGERTRLEVVHEFELIGFQRLTVGESSRTVDVRRPASASIPEFAVEPREITTGESVDVQVLVRNVAAHPGEATLVITRDGNVAGERSVKLDAGANETVTVTLQFPRPGRFHIGIRDSSLSSQVVTVRPADAWASPLVGAGIGVVLVTFLVSLVLLMYRDVRKRA